MNELENYLKAVTDKAKKIKDDAANSKLWRDLKEIVEETKIEAREEILNEMKADNDYRSAKHFFDISVMPTDIIDKEDCKIFRISIPGYKKENIEIKIQENDLIVNIFDAGNSCEESYDMREIEIADYNRTYKLNEEMEREATATYIDGMLEIIVKKKKPAVNKISIS